MNAGEAFPSDAAFREFADNIRQLRLATTPTGITATLTRPSSGMPEIQANPPKIL